MKINIFQTRKLHLPAYIIVVDHATKSVVLSVRGTFSVEDAVTDLVCDSAGVLHAAFLVFPSDIRTVAVPLIRASRGCFALASIDIFAIECGWFVENCKTYR